MEKLNHQFCAELYPMSSHRKRILIVQKLACVILLFFLIFFSAMQDVLAQVPGELVPGRQGDALPTQAPQATPPPLIPEEPRRQKPPDHSEEITFVLGGITVTGAETFSPARLSRMWAHLVGQEISVATLYEVANRITRFYVDAGYALSFAFVPEQEIGEEGMVTIRVVEGFVDDILFTGDFVREDKVWYEGTSPLPPTIGEYAEKILASRPLKTADMERYILLINDQPGISARAVFSASEETQNASRMIVEISRKPIDVQATADNHLSSSLDHFSFGATGTMHGVFTGADSLSVTIKCGLMCDSYKYFATNYSNYVGGEGAKISLGITHSNISPVNGPLTLLDFEGNDTSYTFDASYPLIRSRAKNLSIGAGFAWSDNETETFAGALTEDHTRTATIYASYDFAGPSGAVTFIRGSMTQGLPLFGATEDDDALKSRAGGSADFTNLNVTLSRNQPLGAMGASFGDFSLFATGAAQVAMANPLLSSSQCYYGGSDIGRGYNSGSVGGDTCLTGLAELRYDWPWENWLMQAYGFGDFGTVWRKGNSLSAGEESSATAKSMGGGFRMNMEGVVQGDLMVAMPLDKEETSNGKASPKFLFSMSVQY